jgi:dTDP-4-amino-4,6-dideoxygalactose transaminase
MPDVLAALALGQIKKYANKLIPERRRVFEIYYEGFKDWVHAQNPSFDDGESVSSFHLYALRINEVTEIQRDKIIDLVMESGVSVNVHFQPLPMLSVFKNRGYDIEDYPVAKDSYTREISLPIYPQLTDGQALKVVEEIKKATEIVLS